MLSAAAVSLDSPRVQGDTTRPRQRGAIALATTRLDPENMRLSETGQTGKDKKHDFTHRRDIKQKAANNQTKQTNKKPSSQTGLRGGGGRGGRRGLRA